MCPSCYTSILVGSILVFPAIHGGNQDGVPAFYPGPAFIAIWKSGSADKSLSSKNKSLKRVTQYKAGHKFILFHMSFQNAEKCVISGVRCRGLGGCEVDYSVIWKASVTFSTTV